MSYRVCAALFSLLTLLSVAVWVPLLSGAEAVRLVLDPQLPYQAERSEPVTYQVDYAVIVTAPQHTRLLRVWLPLPPSDVGQEVKEGPLTTFPMTVQPRIGKEARFGNTFAYFEFVNPQGAQIIRHQFQIKVWQLNWRLEPQKVQAVQWPDSFAPYLKSDRSVNVDNRFYRAVETIVPQRQGPARDLATVMDWLQAHMKYDHAQASLQASSEHALLKRIGHCSDYHSLCAAFGRALGFPTRVTYGINPFPKNSPSHCKLEAYLPPYGWVSFDVSETQQLIAAINREPSLNAAKKQALIQAATSRLRQGFRDNTWFLQTRGTDYELTPPASQRVAVVRTIYAEADGVPLPEPDPANASQKEFAWMTAHRYTADRVVPYPFRDWRTLLAPAQE